jgi:hypothetical protein
MVRATALELLQGYPGPESLELAALSVEDPDPAVRRAALGILGAAPMEQRLTLLKDGLGDPVMAVRIESGRMLAGVDPHIVAQMERTGIVRDIGRENLFQATQDIGEALMQAVAAAESWIEEKQEGNPNQTADAGPNLETL